MSYSFPPIFVLYFYFSSFKTCAADLRYVILSDNQTNRQPFDENPYKWGLQEWGKSLTFAPDLG